MKLKIRLKHLIYISKSLGPKRLRTKLDKQFAKSISIPLAIKFNQFIL